jgi:hypothetical protein
VQGVGRDDSEKLVGLLLVQSPTSLCEDDIVAFISPGPLSDEGSHPQFAADEMLQKVGVQIIVLGQSLKSV